MAEDAAAEGGLEEEEAVAAGTAARAMRSVRKCMNS
jgi:hypothetical protein